jgi:EAL domain-containing protein (putative c-di-GMP-specific phosphodiesterase class I)/GGDEF domain-containing protein
MGIDSSTGDDVYLKRLAETLTRAANASLAGIYLAKCDAANRAPFRYPIPGLHEDWLEVEDTGIDERFGHTAHCHYLALPVRIEPLQLRGAVWMLWDAPGRVGTEERKSLKALAELIGSQLSLRYCDQGTGIANETWFMHALQELLDAPAQEVRVGHISVVSFSRVNDAYGVAAGYELLAILAQRLVAWAGPDAVLAHLGGERFAFALPGSAKATAHRLSLLHPVINTPAALACNKQYTARARVGLRVAKANCGLHPAVLLHEAANAANSATMTSISTYQTASRMESALLVGLNELLCGRSGHGELEVHYEPQFDLRTGSLTGLEALVRWRHPVVGLLYPKDFLAFVEQSSKMFYLDMSVLRTVCQNLREWREAGNMPQVPIALNFARESLLVDGMVDKVAQQLGEFGIEGRHFECEITESNCSDTKGLQVRLLGLRSLGMQIAIDDFGTGHSNFETIRQLSFDKLKVDRQFVDGVADDDRLAELLQLIVNAGRLFGAEILCEGVEQVRDLDWLAEHGVTRFQGWYFSRALVPSQAMEAVRRLAHPKQALSPAQIQATIRQIQMPQDLATV